MMRIARWEAVMQRSLQRKIGKRPRLAGTIIAMALLVMLAGIANAKKKEKVYLPDYVLKAQTVLVVILPNSGEPMNDPFANRTTQQDVEKAFMKWGRYRLALDTTTADLVIGVRKGTGQAANATMNGGPLDTDRRPGTIETTDNQIRIGAQRGTPPSTTQEQEAGGISGQNSPNDRPHRGMEAGAQDDTFMVFQGGAQYPLDNAPVWRHIAKDGLKPPSVSAVEQFRKAVEESEKAAAQKQQQQQKQKKNP
jgi:hypothetical protein